MARFSDSNPEPKVPAFSRYTVTLVDGTTEEQVVEHLQQLEAHWHTVNHGHFSARRVRGSTSYSIFLNDKLLAHLEALDIVKSIVFQPEIPSRVF
ncbi:hypothetical protein HDU90_001409 [Geranomyces variabilis]|nr:hypothetical protein HDU90_001409 [Geranomyces variabilis]